MTLPRRPLLLHGFMGAGKSTIGRIAATRAGVPFADLDQIVEARAGKSIAALFAEAGEPAFRALEAETLDQLLQDPNGPQVIALGGGALLDQTRRRAILERAFIATLTAPPRTLLDRTAGLTRPLLGPAIDPAARLEKITALLAERAAAYAEAHAQLSTEEAPPEAIAERVLAAWTTPTLAIPLGPRTYTVRFVRRDLRAVGSALTTLRPSATFVVTDENVQAHWGKALGDALSATGHAPRATTVLRPGEEHKRLAAVEQALAAMVEAGADRDAVVIGHGGGVVTDIAGFAAATLLRGVRWIPVPTTLLGMVDASVGGKTGVDLGSAKNAVGAFHQPSAVILDTAQVETESARAYRGGLAEVVKAACIGDPALFDLLERSAAQVLARDSDLVEEIAFRAVAVKAGIVSRDERESGERALLNFGHTLGHALEAAGGFSRLTHGEAVSLGMVAMLRVGQALGRTDAAEAARIVALLERLGLPVELDPASLRAALPLVALDKKRRAGAVRAVVPERIGQARIEPIALGSLPGLLGLA
ncbi:MAG: 3-dehydroquinate synthase [Byssovorax sp.]